MTRQSLSVAVVVPTRNRPELVRSLLKNLNSLDCLPKQIIIIDSSDDEELAKIVEDFEKIHYQHVQIKSAAAQRNIGLLLVENEIEYVCFLDDDVIVPTDYLSKLIASMEEKKGIGISGMAINMSLPLRDLPKGLIGLVHRLFFLDSKRDGVILRSGINIPVRKPNQGTKYVKWLIGCSIWKRSSIEGLKFEKDLMGQSLGEDVIFSFKANKRGKLLVNTDVILNHLESPVSRPNDFEFWKMWILNRRLLIRYMGNSLISQISYHWANFGQLLILVISRLRNRKRNWDAPKGIVIGVMKVLISSK